MAKQRKTSNEKKKVKINEKKNVEHKFTKEEESDEENHMIEEEIDEEEEVETQSFDLMIAAGTYNNMLLGWKYVVETRVDFEHIVQSFLPKKDVNEEMEQAIADNDEEIASSDEENDENERAEKEEEEQEDEIDAMIDEDLEGTSDPSMTRSGEEVLTPSFSVKAHNGSVNCISSESRYLVTGGFDENISTYDLKKKREFGVIHVTEGAVTSLVLSGNYIFVGSAHGTLSVFYLQPSFPKVLELQAHANTIVKKISVHPSGRLVLTLGELDHRLRLWNMLNGTLLQTISLGLKTFLDIQWSPSGDTFAILQRNSVQVMSANCEQTADISLLQLEKKATTQPQQPTCFKYLSEKMICVGFTDGTLAIYNIETSTLQHNLGAVHKGRVKDIDALEVNIGEFSLVSVSSVGSLAVHRVTDEFYFLEDLKDVNARLTCVTIQKKDQIAHFVAQRYQSFEKWLESL